MSSTWFSELIRALVTVMSFLISLRIILFVPFWQNFTKVWSYEAKSLKIRILSSLYIMTYPCKKGISEILLSLWFLQLEAYVTTELWSDSRYNSYALHILMETKTEERTTVKYSDNLFLSQICIWRQRITATLTQIISRTTTMNMLSLHSQTTFSAALLPLLPAQITGMSIPFSITVHWFDSWLCSWVKITWIFWLETLLLLHQISHQKK